MPIGNLQLVLDIRINTYYNDNRQREVKPVRYSEVEKLLKKAKCTVFREGANHTMWYSPITGKTFPVSRHRSEEVPEGTLKAIMRDAGLK